MSTMYGVYNLKEKAFEGIIAPDGRTCGIVLFYAAFDAERFLNTEVMSHWNGSLTVNDFIVKEVEISDE